MFLMMAERRERGKNEQINSDVIESDEREHQRPNVWELSRLCLKTVRS
jgi:hypothetical protein